MEKISKLARSIGAIDRVKLLPYKNKNNKMNNKSIKMFNIFDILTDFLRKVFDNSFLKMKENVLSNNNKQLEFLKNLSLKQFNSIGTNIGTSLIHGFKSKKIKTNVNKKCNLIHVILLQSVAM